MHAERFNNAVLENLRGAYLPPVALPVPAEFQSCVDAGVLAAVGLLDDLAVFCLHEHIAVSMQVFMSSLERAATARSDQRAAWPASRRQACIDAFAAGYLGRIQQELHLAAGGGQGRIE